MTAFGMLIVGLGVRRHPYLCMLAAYLIGAVVGRGLP